MAKIVTMPTSPNFVKRNFSLQRTIGSVSSPYTGKIRTQEFDGVFWKATVSLPPMRRSIASQWQSFLLQCNGPVNHFRFADPDALTQQGTYTGEQFVAEARVNETSITLSFAASTNTITAASGTPFANALVGDFIVVTGSSKTANNGTHKITTKTNNTTIIVDPVDAESLVDESSVASCTIKVNVKGAKGLCVKSTGNAHAGTILQGDYLGVSAATTNIPTTYTPSQYVQVVENATETNNGGSAKNQYALRTEPKLRNDIVTNGRVFIDPAKGLFRLGGNLVEWDADQISNYGISFDVIEVI